jgi:hypothetical protein
VKEVVKGDSLKSDMNLQVNGNEEEGWFVDDMADDSEGAYKAGPFKSEMEAERFIERMHGEGLGSKETKFSKYQLPGGENYREMLLTLPEVKESVQVGEAEPIGKEYGNKEFMGMWEGRYPIMGVKSYPFSIGNQNGRITYWPWTVRPNGDRGVEKYIVDSPNMQNAGFASMEAARAAIEESYNESGYMQRARTDQYRSSHWNEPNILAHVRMNDRTTADGKKTLFIEEVQSDWHQKGREVGYSAKGKTKDIGSLAGIEKDGYWEIVNKDGEFITNVFLVKQRRKMRQ